ncbi:MAG: PAS domain-containing protein [Gemmatimonadales bacterium]|nr:PAS domain-containing protein [Gemmatimonadales bacterium]
MTRATTGAWSWEPATGHVACSAELRALLGLGPDGPAPEPTALLAGVPAPEREAVRARFRLAARSGAPLAIEHGWQRSDGAVRRLRAAAQAVRDATGAVRVLLGTTTDLTALEEAEAPLRALREQLSAVLEHTSAGLWEWDPRSGLVRVNAQWLLSVGLDPDGADAPHPLGLWTERLHPDDAPRVLADLHACADGRLPTLALEYRLRHASGEWRWVSARGFAVRDAAGAVDRVTGFLLDETEQRRSAERQRRLAQELQWAQELVGLGRVTLDALRGKVALCETARQMLRLPEGVRVVPAARLRAMLDDGDAAALAAAAARTTPEAPRFGWEAALRTEHGERRWLRGSGEVRRNADGALVAIAGVVLDVTEQREAEARHADDARRLRAAQRVARIGTWERDLDSERLEWSPETYAICGVPPGTPVTSEGFAAMVHVDDRARWDAARHRALAHGQAIDLLLRVVRPDGEERHVQVVGDVVDADAGSAGRLTGVLMDVTDRHRQEERLRLMSSVVVHAHDAVVITEAHPLDEPGPRIVYVNDAFTRLTGYAPEEVIGRSPRLLQAPGTDRAALARVRQALRAWRPVTEELLNRHKDGEERWVELSIVPVADESGWFTHWVSVQRDVTARRRAADAMEAALHRQRELALAAEAAARSKSEFLANMSHEIRTPMNGVLGTLDIVLGTPLEPDQRRLVETSYESARALLQVLDDILDFSKIEAGKLQLVREPFDLRRSVAHVLELFRQRAEPSGLSLTAELDPAIPARLAGDEGRLRQVLLNLVGNAVKFTHDGGVEVRASVQAEDADGLLLRVEVEDSGIGLAPAAAARLFQPFEQADASTTRRYGGTGLGLTICRQLVAMMGGTIGVTSEEGIGSTFTFTVRLGRAEDAGAPEAAVAAPAPVTTGAALAGARVLLAEDHPINRMVALELLQPLGVLVDVAEDGAQAVQAAGRTAYDLVLMDCQMPVLDGFEAATAIRAAEGAGRRVPIVALTANAMRGDRERCLAAGMDDHVAKPVTRQALLEALGRWLGPGRDTAAGRPAAASPA